MDIPWVGMDTEACKVFFSSEATLWFTLSVCQSFSNDMREIKFSRPLFKIDCWFFLQRYTFTKSILY